MERFATLSEATIAFDVAGSGPHLVWCHGLASCREGDRDVIEAFREHFTVLAYDARGHGSSGPVRDESLFTYEHLSRDLRDLLAFLGWRGSILAGASMGAATAARAALEDLAIARAVIMARPGASEGASLDRLRVLFRMGAVAIRDGGLDAAIEFLMTIPEAREAIEKDPSRLDGLRVDWGRHDPHSIAAALEGVPSSPPLAGDLDPAALTAPVLVVPGNDPIHPTDAGLAVAAMFPTARATEPFDSLPRAQETALFVETVLGFLRDAHVLD